MRRITLYIYQNSYVSQSGGGAPKAWITPDHPGSPRITPSDPHGSPPLEHPGSSTDHTLHRVGEGTKKAKKLRLHLMYGPYVISISVWKIGTKLSNLGFFS